MSKKSNYHAPRVRTSLKLERTRSRPTFLLDFASAAALQYSQAVAGRMGGLSVSSSAIARRALVVYALHIERQARELQAGARLGEWGSIRASSEGQNAADSMHSLDTEEQAQAKALERIQALSALPEGEPLPGFLESLHGPAVVAARAASRADLDRRQGELLAAVAATPWARLKGIHNTLTDNT